MHRRLASLGLSTTERNRAKSRGFNRLILSAEEALNCRRGRVRFIRWRRREEREERGGVYMSRHLPGGMSRHRGSVGRVMATGEVFSARSLICLHCGRLEREIHPRRPIFRSPNKNVKRARLFASAPPLRKGARLIAIYGRSIVRRCARATPE